MEVGLLHRSFLGSTIPSASPAQPSCILKLLAHHHLHRRQVLSNPSHWIWLCCLASSVSVEQSEEYITVCPVRPKPPARPPNFQARNVVTRRSQTSTHGNDSDASPLSCPGLHIMLSSEPFTLAFQCFRLLWTCDFPSLHLTHHLPVSTISPLPKTTAPCRSS